MMPVVTVWSSPKGLPIAITPSPTSTAEESASLRGLSADAGASTSITARSVDGSAPTTLAGYVFPFANLTETDWAPSTTCWFVITWPWVS